MMGEGDGEGDGGGGEGGAAGAGAGVAGREGRPIHATIMTGSD